MDATYIGLLEDVLDHPSDDTPRLVMADWLEEQGEGDRAEFIRLQVELMATADPYGDRYWDGQLGDEPTRYQRRKSLRRRERELLIGSPTSWGANGQFSDWLSGLGHGWPGGEGDMTWTHIRGFISSVTLILADYLEHAAEVFAWHPVTGLRLADKKPYPNGGGQCWYDVNRSGVRSQLVPAEAELPSDIFDLLVGWIPEHGGGRWRAYPDEVAANTALSVALVANGRKLSLPIREARRQS